MIVRTFEDVDDALFRLISELGDDGGKVSPSVYDTAQLLRFYAPSEGARPALEWLLAQQLEDGGWSNPDIPTSRDVPTLAAIMAIHTLGGDDAPMAAAVDAGVEFLEHRSDVWSNLNIDSLPIAAELILPVLAQDAHAMGLPINIHQYRSLGKHRRVKLDTIRGQQLAQNSPPTYSWEVLGLGPESITPDQSGGIGHSPSATARWLQVAGPTLCPARRRCAEDYLQKAANATGVGIAGVVPNVWPITGFELAYGLYALHITGILTHAAQMAVVERKTEQLHKILLQGDGVSFGEFFVPDVDGTATAVSALIDAGYAIDPNMIWRFFRSNHFITFQHELNPSILSNAHAVHALSGFGDRSKLAEEFLLNRQQPEGHWLPDKWHSSWIYATFETVVALCGVGYRDVAYNVLSDLVTAQRSDGSWSARGHSSALDTAYALLAMSALRFHNIMTDSGEAATAAGVDWLLRNSSDRVEALWMGKELYSPRRVDEIYISAALTVNLQVLQKL